MGNRPRNWLTAFFMAVVAVLLTCLFFREDEPRYEGKSLSDWVVAMRDGPDREGARKVVHRMGTNAWPLFLEWLQREDRPTLKGRLKGLRPGVEGWLVSHKWIKPRPISSSFDAKGSYRALGTLALEELGPEGKAAIPGLICLLGYRGSKPDEVSAAAGAAFMILPMMAPDSVGPLIQALSSTNAQVQAFAAGALGNIGTNANAAIPFMERRLHSTNCWTRISTCDAFEKIGGDPRVFVPVVIANLREGSFDNLNFQIEFLVRNKTHAKSAVPLLVALLTNTPDSGGSTNDAIRVEVSRALREIDPEAAAKAGIK